ncbi:MAG TPA: type III-A CRISPR-associated RAMP protein Csm4 [Methanocorpusculum sp.]|nr:type III-A CRISPR-associated RAMP protein Csm4 [Methanocorpusculum sp.]
MTFAVFLHPRSLFPEKLPSNTLFGAVCSAMADLGIPVDSLIAAYDAGNVPFLLSSAFPFGTDASGRRVCFVPKPIQPPPRLSEHEFEWGKKLKGIRWVEASVFSDIASGKVSFSEIPALLERKVYVVANHALVPKSVEFSGMPVFSSRTHNALDRLMNESTAYYETEGMIYPKCSGMYCLVKAETAEIEQNVRAALRYLSDRGLGKRISRGFGAFSVSFSDEIPFVFPSSGEFMMSLSRYIPSSEEFSAFGGDMWYEMEEICGISADGMRRRKVRMLSEGSVFRKCPGWSRCGRVVRVRENPPVVEFGMMFPCPLQISGGRK